MRRDTSFLAEEKRYFPRQTSPGNKKKESQEQKQLFFKVLVLMGQVYSQFIPKNCMINFQTHISGSRVRHKSKSEVTYLKKQV